MFLKGFTKTPGSDLISEKTSFCVYHLKASLDMSLDITFHEVPFLLSISNVYCKWVKSQHSLTLTCEDGSQSVMSEVCCWEIQKEQKCCGLDSERSMMAPGLIT